MSRPLDGTLVVSLEQAIAAPYCTRLLADQGARIIKVERPDGGDFARAYDKRTRGLSATSSGPTGRRKASRSTSSRHGTGRARPNHRPGRRVRAEPGAGRCRPARPRSAGAACRVIPRLVYCSISGYGHGGAMAERKAYDLLIQAEAGFLSVTGTKDEMAKAGISIADIAAGVTAYHLILAALIQRGRTGAGRPHRRVDAGGDGRMAGLSHVLRYGRRRAAAAQRRRPCHHLSVWTLPTLPTAPCFSGCRTTANGRPSRPRCCTARSSRATRGSRATPAALTTAMSSRRY